MRDSCRVVGTERLIQESWGGAKYPLPFVGEYKAYAYLFDPKTKTAKEAWTSFRIEGYE